MASSTTGSNASTSLLAAEAGSTGPPPTTITPAPNRALLAYQQRQGVGAGHRPAQPPAPQGYQTAAPAPAHAPAPAPAPVHAPPQYTGYGAEPAHAGNDDQEGGGMMKMVCSGSFCCFSLITIFFLLYGLSSATWVTWQYERTDGTFITFEQSSVGLWNACDHSLSGTQGCVGLTAYLVCLSTDPSNGSVTQTDACEMWNKILACRGLGLLGLLLLVAGVVLWVLGKVGAPGNFVTQTKGKAVIAALIVLSTLFSLITMAVGATFPNEMLNMVPDAYRHLVFDDITLGPAFAMYLTGWIVSLFLVCCMFMG